MPLPKTVDVFAPAKVNLTLHVTGQRDDGFHLIDSLVVFAPVGDQLTLTRSDRLELTVTGPEAAGVPDGPENLVIRAARSLSKDRGAAMTLTKNLPAASGIGGGSADAAAVLRALLALWDMGHMADWVDADLMPFASRILELGADVPMCLLSQSARVCGIGEKVEPVAAMPRLPALLVNPRVSVSTPQVFARLRHKDSPPMPATLPDFTKISVPDWLQDQRNDLQPPAIDLAPEIGRVLDALAQTGGAILTRMSGSGATCFALYTSPDAAIEAGRKIHRDHPGWWLAGGELGDQLALATPRIR